MSRWRVAQFTWLRAACLEHPEAPVSMGLNVDTDAGALGSGLSYAEPRAHGR
jgi:hypothetical protein